MPIPIPLLIAAAAFGGLGIAGGVHGGQKMKVAGKIRKSTQQEHEKSVGKFEKKNRFTYETMDKLGELELKILSRFEDFSNVMEAIQNRPQFSHFEMGEISLPEYEEQSLKQISVRAGVLLGGLGGATLGSAGGMAASGAVGAVIMSFGTASTGTAISTLSGAAAVNATLAALGGGSLAAGGGGMALGATVLGATAAGAGLMVGGLIFSLAGSMMAKKADEEYQKVQEEQNDVNKICFYLDQLKLSAERYMQALEQVYEKYQTLFHYVSNMVLNERKTDWNSFTEKEKLMVQNTVLLVGLLYNMCQIKLVLQSENENSTNQVNKEEIREMMERSDRVLKDMI